ncbi:unnamed protein product [Urochloa humidicola]
MQCTFDGKGNSVPTILMLMQERLYAQGGLKAEGIFRINPENDQEEHVRDQLNKGVVPEDIEVHCLASLIKVAKICMCMFFIAPGRGPCRFYTGWYELLNLLYLKIPQRNGSLYYLMSHQNLADQVIGDEDRRLK